MTADIFASGFKQEPYWWDEAPRPKLRPSPLPEKVDVAVIGSGMVGLNCARVLARGGCSVLVLDSQDPGFGASSRLAGHIGRTPRYSFAKAQDKFGLERAIRLFEEARDAQDAVRRVIEDEKIDAGVLWRGRFYGCCAPEHLEAAVRNAELTNKYVPMEFTPYARAEQHQVIGTNYYYGGIVSHYYGILHSAKYHQGLLDAALSAGVSLAANTAVLRLIPGKDGYALETDRGRVAVKDVAICTNGYTNTAFGALPWVRRRIIPIPANQICTEELSPELMKDVMPKGLPITDSKENIYWVRPTPDEKRLIFGARTGHDERDPRIMAEKLRTLMVGVYPQLAETRLSHVWQGIMGFTFDKLPHIGETRDGVHYATGFCGAGLALGTYLGEKLGHRILGDGEGETAYSGLGFPTWPFYNGSPWALPLIIAWVDYKDARERRRTRKSD